MHGRPVAVVAGYRTVQVWDLVSYRRIGDRLCVPQDVTAVALHEDGRIVVCCGTDIAVFAGRADVTATHHA